MFSTCWGFGSSQGHTAFWASFEASNPFRAFGSILNFNLFSRTSGVSVCRLSACQTKERWLSVVGLAVCYIPSGGLRKEKKSILIEANALEHTNSLLGLYRPVFSDPAFVLIWGYFCFLSFVFVSSLFLPHP